MSKILYLHRIDDKAYFIYKLSNYGRDKIKLIDVGMAYTDLGDYTDKFKKKIEKYNLEQYDNCCHNTAETYKEFLLSLYLDSEQRNNTIPIPTKVYEIIEPIALKIIDEKLRN